MPWFNAPDGARIFYEDEGSGRPLLLLHGMMASKDFFAFQKPLASEFRVISVDLRGHGGSRDATGEMTVEQMAADVTALVEHIGLEDAIGVGWSLGATILWEVLASEVGRRFAASVIVDMTPCVLNRDGWELGLAPELCDARTFAIADDFHGFAANAGEAIFAQPLNERTRGLAAFAVDEFTRNRPEQMGPLWASLMRQDCRAQLSSIEQPSLIIRGAHSQLYGPSTAEYLEDTLPDARLITFDRSGHAPHMEQPELFNQALKDFAAELPRVRESQTTN